MIEFPRERKKQTTKFNVGDVIIERDYGADKENEEEILDFLFILKADHGDETSDDAEDYVSYYTFYSYKEEDVWQNEPLDNGVMIYYEKM